jgi:hypothetical protein
MSVRGIIARVIRRAGPIALIVLASACAIPPKPTKGTVARAANPRAVVEGTVRDPAGNGVSGVSVRGLPRDKDVGWSPAAVTDDAGRFRLEVVAPGDYGFLLSWRGITVVTQRDDDPSRVAVRVVPLEHLTGVTLVFRREEWERALLSPPTPH